jgi:F-type H+-transporting ATPase subunit delta
MNQSGLARRYAQALFDVAKERGATDRIDGDFKTVRSLLADNRDLADFLSTPRVAPEQKQAAIRSIFENRVDVVLLEFLLLLRRKGRFSLLSSVGDEYHELLMDDRKATSAIVTTAVPLSDAERRSLKAALDQRTGMSVELDETVDPAIIGGVVVVCRGQIYDDSIRHHLQTLREELSAVSVHIPDDEGYNPAPASAG